MQVWGAPLGGRWACPPAVWAEPGDSLGTWAGPSVTGISVQRGVRAEQGGPGLGLSSVVSPQLWAGEQVVSRGREAGSGSSPGWWEEVQGQQGGGSGWRSARWPGSLTPGGDCHSEPGVEGWGACPLPAPCGWGRSKEAPSQRATDLSQGLPLVLLVPAEPV